jgi:hypothetical protein
MLIQIKKNRFIYLSFYFLFIIIFIFFISKQEIKFSYFQFFNIKTKQSFQYSTLPKSLLKSKISFNNLTYLQNKTFETKIKCIGPLYNQSCLFENLYYFDSAFIILTIKGIDLPTYSVRTNAFVLWNTKVNKRVFDSYNDLENFVRNIIQPKVIPSVTLYFGQFWHHNIGHALFDGLYPAYVALIRFSPRHLYPFRILAGLDDCNNCWSEDVYSRFAGLGILKENVLNKMSKGKWFLFDELIMGSGTMCQRCTQPNLQLPGGIELDGSRLFRDRMYKQHGFIPLIVRHKSSSEGRHFDDLLIAYVIDNKRFTNDDKKQINDAIHEINSYTNIKLSKTNISLKNLEWPLIHVFYIHYKQVKATKNFNAIQVNATSTDFRSPIYELIDNNFMAQLKILHKSDIHIVGPGTGQMYQTFLSDGSVNINLGGIRPEGLENIKQVYTSYLEQHMTSGTPYIKGLYYPMNQRTKGIQKDQVIKLIRQAGQIILEGFSLPVNPLENLASDGQLFVEMCQKDKEFCSLVTTRSPNTNFNCLDIWIEDFVHEYRQWNLGGFSDNGKNISCPFNHTLLHQLRNKYRIKHYSDHFFKNILTKFFHY